MQIRSLTLGTDISWPFAAEPVKRAGRFLAGARRRYEEAGIGVQTVRLSTPPFPQILGWSDAGRAPALARALEAACGAEGIGYCSLGPVPAWQGERARPFYEVIPELVCCTAGVFATADLGNKQTGLDFAAVAAAARAIPVIAATSDLGFGNLRFAALANCPANVPFFPAAYHGGGPNKLSIALQMADLVVEAFTGVAPAVAEANLTAAVERAAGVVERIALALAAEYGVEYVGIDLSPAPFPEQSLSIGEAVERLGVGGFGAPGTLFAAALITRALRKANVRRCGFSGLMMPVLEDAVLARRAAEGVFTVPEALLYSAVCGTGLDTVPLPGDISVGHLEGILLDVATLALTLDKPLTARLMPVPGKKAGERTTFDFPYFANSAIMQVHGAGADDLVRRALDG
ncbi:MAG: DUF711 family protein [Chloroflexota bacterium]